MKIAGVRKMNISAKKVAFLNSPLVIYTLAVAFLFTLGFFIHFGREARATKSWHYVMPDGDPLYYWSVAKGRMMTPRCDGNPFYYEEQGQRHIIPFTTAEAVGLFSKYTRIPFSLFFPAWHILMPIFTWLILVLCCWKLWGYPLDISAPGVLVLLLLTLYCPWAGIQMILLRFSRPLDGIAPLFLWVSLIYRGDPGNKTHRAAIQLAAALTLWLQPYNAAFGLWITAIEYLYSLTKRKGFLSARLYLCALGGCLISGIIFALYVSLGKGINPGILDTKGMPSAEIFFILMSGLMFALVVTFVLFFHLRFKKDVTAMDRLMIEWASWGFFVYMVSTRVPAAREAPIHMLYFAVLILFSLTGWIYEKLCFLKETHLFPRPFDVLMICLFGSLLALAIAGKNFFAVISSHYFVHVLQYFLILLFPLWLLVRANLLRRVVQRKEVLWSLIFLITIVGYWRFPIYKYNRNFHFDGGYQWLKRHALRNDVVLTATADSRFGQYLFLETGLKSFFYIHGGNPMSPAQAFRRDFATGLLLGLVDKMPMYGAASLERKLRVFKLDYILIPMPSPFFDAVTIQLKGHLQEVYQDPRCLIWRVL